MAKIGRRLRLMRRRYTFEVRRPRLDRSDIAARIDSAAGVDVVGAGGFASFIASHLAATPRAPVWEGDDSVEIPGEVVGTGIAERVPGILRRAA